MENMYKIISYALTIFITTGCIAAANGQNLSSMERIKDMPKDNPKPRIKSLQNQYFRSNNRNDVQKKEPFNYYNGHHREYFLYDENGDQIKFRGYNTQGQLKEESNGSVSAIIDSSSIYNEYGDIIKKRFHFSNKILKEINYLNGEIVKQTIRYPENISIEIIITDGSPDYQNVYKGKKLERTTKYNKNGYPIEELFFTEGVITPRQVFEYNDMNQQIKEIDYDAHGVKSYIYEYKYNENGDVSERIFYSRNTEEQGFDRSTIIYRYKYDKIGNWTERTENQKDNLIVTKRDITYYNQQ